jgi:hypothetical protein
MKATKVTYCTLRHLRETTRSLKVGNSTDSDTRSRWLGCCWEKVVLGEKFDHEAIEKPGLLDLTGMAGAGQSLQLTIGYACLQRESTLMAVVLAAGQNDRRTGDTLMMAVRIRLRQRFELMDDRFHVGVSVAFAEKVRKEVRQWSGAKRRA